MAAPTTPRWQPSYRRLLALVLRPIAPPLWLGVVVAAGFIAAELGLVLLLERVAPENAFGALFLLGVLVVSAGWGFGLAIATSLASAAVYTYIHAEGAPGLVPALAVFLPLALLTNVLTGQARLRALEAEQRRLEADLSAELARSTLRAENLQAALAAAGARIAEVLNLPFAVLELSERPGDEKRESIVLRDGGEVVGSLLIPADLPRPARRADGAVAGGADGSHPGPPRDHRRTRGQPRRGDGTGQSAGRPATGGDIRRPRRRAGRGVSGRGDRIGARPRRHARDPGRLRGRRHRCHPGHPRRRGPPGIDCRRTLSAHRRQPERTHPEVRPERIDDYLAVDSAIAERLRELHVCAGVAAPVTVDGTVRGALVAGSVVAEPLPPDSEDRVRDFADLVATAILNTENRAALKASRSRIVAAADLARRRFERDLHDGAQQRIVTLGLQLRALQSSAQGPTRDGLERVINDLSEVNTDLQELSRGIHPAILSRGGLGPAIKTLARRSSVPVDLDLDVDRRFADSVEVAAYYVVADALTNIAKHAQASHARVHAVAPDGQLRITVSDAGVGGATTSGGSGLIGLKDRIEAVPRRLEVASPPGAEPR